MTSFLFIHKGDHTQNAVDFRPLHASPLWPTFCNANFAQSTASTHLPICLTLTKLSLLHDLRYSLTIFADGRINKGIIFLSSNFVGTFPKYCTFWPLIIPNDSHSYNSYHHNPQSTQYAIHENINITFCSNIPQLKLIPFKTYAFTIHIMISVSYIKFFIY
jgi:hypothetical protein